MPFYRTPGETKRFFSKTHVGRDQLLSRGKSGLDKLVKSAAEAAKNGYKYLWDDTCCIDKSSSAELSEAINSMLEWYRRAEVCYVYLADFDYTEGVGLGSSSVRWFTRGWTLQELIAPFQVHFYDKNWVRFGDKQSLAAQLVAATNIHELVFLWHPYDRNLHPSSHLCRYCRTDLGHVLRSFNIATRMSWAAHRKTTRPEDLAYSLLGIFNVNMPMIYGEGPRAFFRLQQAILEHSADQSILAFDSLGHQVPGWEGRSILATHPQQFVSWIGQRPCEPVGRGGKMALTNNGLEVDVHIALAKWQGSVFPTAGPDLVWLAVLRFPLSESLMRASAIPLFELEDKDQGSQNQATIRHFSRLATDDTWTVSIGSDIAESTLGRKASKSCPRHRPTYTNVLVSQDALCRDRIRHTAEAGDYTATE